MVRFFSWRRERRDGALIRAELENLSAWAEREWPVLWEVQFGITPLDEALHMFLTQGADHARGISIIDREPNSVIAKALLRGVARSGTHDASDLEAALGVPMPT